MKDVSNFFLSFLIVFIVEPQQPKWNPLIIYLREKNLFGTYAEAKKALNRITWGIFIIFYFRHFLY